MNKNSPNLIKKDGDVRYLGKVFNELACELFEYLLLKEIKKYQCYLFY